MLVSDAGGQRQPIERPRAENEQAQVSKFDPSKPYVDRTLHRDHHRCPGQTSGGWSYIRERGYKCRACGFVQKTPIEEARDNLCAAALEHGEIFECVPTDSAESFDRWMAALTAATIQLSDTSRAYAKAVND